MKLYLQACDSLTPLGDSAQTAQRLRDGARSLALRPVLGSDGGDAVPISLFHDLGAPLPPRWLALLDDLTGRLPSQPWGSPRHPIVMTSSNYGIDQLFAYFHDREQKRRPYVLAQSCARRVAERYGWGENYWVVSNACVSAQLGIVHARRLLENDQADAVLVFSFDFLSPFITGGFHSMRILNGAMPAPYTDREHSAIGLGDGAAFAVFSREPAKYCVEAEFTHFESAHMTNNLPDGSGFHMFAQAMAKAAKGRRVWIKGHGTGTIEAGRGESIACHAAFPNRPLVSWKGAIGHTLGSCGLVELGIAIAATEQGWIPGTVGSEGPYFANNVTANAFEAAGFDGFVMISSAFGGAHAAHLVSHD